MPSSEPLIDDAASLSEPLEQLAAARERLASALEKRHAKAQQWRATVAARWSDIEAALTVAQQESARRESDLEARLARCASEEQRVAESEQTIAEQRTELAALRQSLIELQHQQAQQQQSCLAELSRSLHELRQREATLTPRLERIAEREAELQRAVERQNVAEERIAELQEALVDQETRSAAAAKALAAQTAELEQQRQQLEIERRALATFQTDLELEKARLRTQRLQLAQHFRHQRRLLVQTRAAAQPAAGDTVLGTQLREALAEISKLRADDDSASRERRSLQRELEQARSEIEALNVRLLEAGPSSEDPALRQETDDLRKRLEMALSDVRDLRARNAELNEQMARSRTSAPVVAASMGDGWEACKQRLLAQLESDYDANDAAQEKTKLSIEETIRRTDEIVAAKDQEIAELHRLLSEQSGNIGGVAIGAAAIAEMLDSDELVRQERENLKDLQEKLREQLRQAEIDLSMERAKVARERALLDEKIRELEDHRQQQAALPSDPTKTASTRGKWLQRLGIRDEEKK
jgi:chromosome segregation ATPase